MRIKRGLVRFVLLALGGLLGEVFYGAALQLWSGNLNMHGQSSPWMMLDYGLLGVILMPIATPMIRKGIPLWARAFVYMTLIYGVEYISGAIFTWGFGLRIWDYSSIPYNLHGQIMLFSAPVWYSLGFGAEFLFHKADAMAAVLLQGVSAQQIEELGQCK